MKQTDRHPRHSHSESCLLGTALSPTWQGREAGTHHIEKISGKRGGEGGMLEKK